MTSGYHAISDLPEPCAECVSLRNIGGICSTCRGYGSVDAMMQAGPLAMVPVKSKLEQLLDRLPLAEGKTLEAALEAAFASGLLA